MDSSTVLYWKGSAQQCSTRTITAPSFQINREDIMNSKCVVFALPPRGLTARVCELIRTYFVMSKRSRADAGFDDEDVSLAVAR